MLIDEGAGEMTLLEGGKVTICEREGKVVFMEGMKTTILGD
ncbi:hypothetical protein [Niallia circulans]